MTLTSPTWTTRFLPLAALLGTALAARAPTFGRRSRKRPPRTLAHYVGTFTVLSVAGMVLAF